MFKVGFDNDLYIQKQSEQISKRIKEFGGKLYLEFGGKLFDDYHASRVLPGFKPDSKLQMLKNLFVGSVVIAQYKGQPAALAFKNRLENLGVRVFIHYPIEGYPYNIPHIVSEEGFGKNEYIETERPLVVITAPGPGSGKMATCLSQLYHDNLRGIKAGYAKFETFPIWNLPLKHPVNLAYEAATADLNDVNVIDPNHQ